jgi:hypothetical protein
MKVGTGSGRDAIEDWLADVPIGERKGVRAFLVATLRHLRFTPKALWKRPQFDWLTGEQYKGVGEVLFDFKNVPYRPLGFFGKESNQFTILIGCKKTRARKGKTKWKPPSAPETAVRRMQELLKGERIAYQFDLDKEGGEGPR